MVPAATGLDAVLSQVVSPLAHHYVDSLTDLAEPREDLLDQLTEELLELMHAKEAVGVSELALGGLEVTQILGPKRGISLRPLSEAEQGAMYAASNANSLGFPRPDPNFFVPARHSFFRPTSLLTAESRRPASDPNDNSDLLRRFVIALILCGFDIETSGVCVRYDLPRWFSRGYQSQPFPLDSGFPLTPRGVSEGQFSEAVDIAYRLPHRSSGQQTRQSVVLERVLRGASRQDGSFLDNAIALEAALLGGANSELRYRFSLYGALYLREERDPETTFKKLKAIYDVRSTIAHGGKAPLDKETQAASDAADLVRAVVRKAVTVGWPKPANLDSLALRLPS